MQTIKKRLLTLPSAAPEKLTQDKIKKIVYGLY